LSLSENKTSAGFVHFDNTSLAFFISATPGSVDFPGTNVGNAFAPPLCFLLGNGALYASITSLDKS